MYNKKERKRLIILFLTPALFFYLLFVIYPMASSFYYFLFKWRGVSTNKTFVGFANLNEALHDEVVWRSLGHNFYFVIGLIIIVLSFSLFFAFNIFRPIKWANLYKTVFFFPNVLSLVLVAIIWSFVYNPSFGILNSFLRMVGLEGWIRTWLGEKGTVLPSITVAASWNMMGFYIILFLAGIKRIPRSFFEAALIDGASNIRVFFSIIMPLLWEIFKVALIYLIIAGLNMFPYVQLMTRGGPNRHSEVLATYIYEQAFTNSRFGYATSIGIILLVVVLGLTGLLFKIMSRETIEY